MNRYVGDIFLPFNRRRLYANAKTTSEHDRMSSNRCTSAGCDQPCELLCSHCCQSYCYLCLMCHRQSLFDEMHLLSEQMSINRQQSVVEVVSFINRQAYDAHQQAKELLDDAIKRILSARERIFSQIEKNRRTKVRRMAISVSMKPSETFVLDSSFRRMFETIRSTGN